MRRRCMTTVLIPLAMLALVATPAVADIPDNCRPLVADEADEATDPFVCEVDYFLQCDEAAAGKVYVLPPLVSALPEFTEEAPAGSFTAGEGCGLHERSDSQGIQQDNINDFTFTGFTDGNLDTIAVELHDLNVSPNRTAEEIQLDIRLTIDGDSPFGTESGESAAGPYTAPTFVPVMVTPVVSDTGATVSYQFTVTGLDEVLGTADDEGVSDQFYEVKFSINSPLDGVHAFVWGATEIPAGVTINPAEPVGTLVAATGP